MTEIRTVTTLRSKRSEILASITLYEKRLSQGRAEVTYKELANRLQAHGFEETKASIANKMARATLSANFFLATLSVLGRDSVAFVD